MIMKAKKVYSWVLRISNPTTGKVDYRSFTYLTVTEVEQVAETIRSMNEDLYVSVFKLHKMY